MSSHPPSQLSRLRDIGWAEWDPIGILSPGEKWDHHPAADEYDRYLLEAASGLRRDWSISDAKDYLMRVASKDMGLGDPHDGAARIRAETTAKAIKDYLDESSLHNSRITHASRNRPLPY
jgi:hypothetical protein